MNDGLILLGPALEVIYSNAEAVDVLAYPQDSRRIQSVSTYLKRTIPSILLRKPSSPEAGFVETVKSGKRIYRCRAFNLRAETFGREERGGSRSLVLFDVDGLKHINDTWGHPAGDRAICAVAQAMQRCRRAHDLAARLGGDELALLMPGTDLSGGERLLARVDAELARLPLELADARVAVRISRGLAMLREEDDTPGQLMARADEALYVCKRQHHDTGSRE